MIERLYVHNFRCFESFTLNLSGRTSTLLIGKNGAGKSTVLHCLRLFQRIGRGGVRVGDVITASDFSQHRIDRPMRFELDMNLGGKRYSYAVSFEWPSGFREARILEERLSVDGNAVFSRKYSETLVSGGGAFGLDWHVFALPIIEERPGADSVKSVKAFFAAMFVVAPIPENISGYSEDATTELTLDASNFASCLRSLISQKPKAYTTFADEIKEMIPDFSSVEFKDRGESGSLLTVTFESAEPQASLTVDFGSLSNGEKCFFLCAYIIASKSAGTRVLCFWDEPDNHLSLSEVGQFIIGLRKAAKHNSQFIATSHHPEAIRSFSDESTLVLTRKSHLDPSVARPLSDFPYNGDLINAIIRDEIIGER